MTAEEKRKNTDYKEHITNKNLARFVQQNLKQVATIPSKNRKCFVFDLLKLLQIPLGENSGFYYCSNNLSCFDLSTKQGYCCVWEESFARRGANKIASCLYKLIELHCCSDLWKSHFLQTIVEARTKTVLLLKCCHWFSCNFKIFSFMEWNCLFLNVVTHTMKMIQNILQ